MANKVPLIVFPVKDLDKAKSFYNTYLATEPYVDGAWYVGYKVGDMEVGLDPNGKTVVSYIDTDDMEASLTTLKGVGAEVVIEPKDVGGGLMVAQVEIEGNTMGLRQQPKK
ncbi:MAG TPA: glyoxalase [Candidatus Saccharimonadia bacterium]|nr:glyoxalase [Candidatus Saccharimonadia bacterium]